MTASARGASALLLLLAACHARAPAPEPKAAPKHEEEATQKRTSDPAPRPLRLAVMPIFGPEEQSRSYAALLEYLGDALETDVELQTPLTYEAAVDRVVAGEVDLVQLAPLAYVMAKERAPTLELLVTDISEGSSSYSSYLVARAGSDLRRIEDLRGKVVGFVDKGSTSGYLYPYAFFLEQGVDPQHYFKRTVMTGRHDVAVDLLLRGEIDVAATFSGALLNVEARGFDMEQLEIVAKTGRVPHDAWCARAALPEGVKGKLRAALLGLSTRTRSGRKILEPLSAINGFAPVSDGAYDEVRRMKKLVEQATE